jgi:hypothetical protein
MPSENGQGAVQVRWPRSAAGSRSVDAAKPVTAARAAPGIVAAPTIVIASMPTIMTIAPMIPSLGYAQLRHRLLDRAARRQRAPG